MDQLTTSSCVGHALVGASETRFHILGQPIVHKAPFCVYDVGRCIDRHPLPNGKLPPLTDHGCEPNQAMRGVIEWGICNYEDRPTVVKDVNKEPRLSMLEDASEFELEGAYLLYPVGDNRDERMASIIGQITQTLASGYPVPAARIFDTESEQWTPNKPPLGASNPHDPHAGGHYIYLVGYEIDSQGKITVEFANSWGDWGDDGFGFGDENFVGDLFDAYAMDVSFKTAPFGAAA
jgi:hypothetical protein